MVREDENTWTGTLGCRRIYVKRISEDELRHWTTDGWFTLIRWLEVNDFALTLKRFSQGWLMPRYGGPLYKAAATLQSN